MTTTKEFTMSAFRQLVHRARTNTTSLRAAHVVAMSVVSLAIVAGFGVGQSLAYQRWIATLLRDAAAMSPELRRRLESFLDRADEAMSSKDEPPLTNDDDTEPKMRSSRCVAPLGAGRAV
jgi:hypothetical protein